MTTRLVLLRHGATAWSAESRYTSHTDVKLSALGIEEARVFASAVREIAPTHVWTSPAGRCQETLDIIRSITPMPAEIVTPTLRECDFGKLEGLSKVEVIDHIGYDQYHRWRLGLQSSAGGVEPYEELEWRAKKALREIILHAEHEARIFVVSHGYIIRAMVASAILGMRAQCLRKIRVDTSHAVEAEWVDEQWRLCGLNVTAAHWLSPAAGG